MDSADKMLSLAALPAWRETLRASGRRLVVTNGVFDLLHTGHVTYLEGARGLGDALLIGVNGDDSVRQLKGPSRPLNPEADRARVLAGLGCVDATCIFPEMRAVNFLSVARPDIYVKGGDYTLDTVNQDERRLIEEGGGKIVLLAHVPGKSTTAVLQKVNAPK